MPTEFGKRRAVVVARAVFGAQVSDALGSRR